jgi:hypothetical protein
MFSALADGQRNQHSGAGLFANAQNTLITGGTFVSISRRPSKSFIHNPIHFICQINVQSANTRGGQMISVPQKPNSTSIFTGRKDILEKLENIFFRRADPSLMSRRSCLLWGMGGIGKTQICLKFTEEMSDR